MRNPELPPSRVIKVGTGRTAGGSGCKGSIAVVAVVPRRIVRCLSKAPVLQERGGGPTTSSRKKKEEEGEEEERRRRRGLHHVYLSVGIVGGGGKGVSRLA
jgi:hypothetical protein